MNRESSLGVGLIVFLFVAFGVPALLVQTSLPWDTRWGSVGAWGVLLYGVGGVLILGGLAMVLATVVLFWQARGTPLPTHPPERLVMRGLYRHVRNPQLLGLFLIFLGEFCLTGAASILLWAAGIATGVQVFLLFYEEPDLERRFGERYRRYKRAVPRWIPRLRPVREAELEAGEGCEPSEHD